MQLVCTGSGTQNVQSQFFADVKQQSWLNRKHGSSVGIIATGAKFSAEATISSLNTCEQGSSGIYSNNNNVKSWAKRTIFM